MLGSKVNDILIFMSVVETGSFVAGGKAFGLSRSTAGKAIARLEESYGARLLNRSTRSLDLTDEGRRLYEHGQSLRQVLEETEADLTGADGVPSGTLRITAPDGLGRRLVLSVVKAYQTRWPDVHVMISLSDRVDNLLEKGFDLAIRISGNPPDSAFISRRVWTDKPMLCAAPSYFQNRDRPRNIEQLTTHELLHFFGKGERDRWLLCENGKDWVRANGTSRLSLDSGEALRQVAIDGLGIALLPRVLIAEDLASGRLEQVLPHVDCGEVNIYALYPHKRLLEPRVRHFIDMLAGRIGRTVDVEG
ncbi:LysR family transcriptional regulator [Roseibium sp.]|uniref:LysR family transcriptional regulator n=1 Tax=Roseibium sp. TaxID=1936156 RepID=UPI003A97E004